MPDEEIHGCHTCASPIIWCVTTRGKRIPIDFAPSPEGSYMKLKMEWNGEEWLKVVSFVPSSEREWVDLKLYTCHWDTCPNSKKNRDRTSTDNRVP